MWGFWLYQIVSMMVSSVSCYGMVDVQIYIFQNTYRTSIHVSWLIETESCFFTLETALDKQSYLNVYLVAVLEVLISPGQEDHVILKNYWPM